MKTIVDEFNITITQNDIGQISEAWVEAPHTAELLGLCEPSGSRFGACVVAKYTRDGDTPPTTRKFPVAVLQSGGAAPSHFLRYLGSWKSQAHQDALNYHVFATKG